MSNSNRKPYQTSFVLDQAFLDQSHDNLVNQLELACDIETPSGTIYVSDRNKYVGGTYYDARINFPVIKRTIGEFLSAQLEFSDLTLEINNVDGIYNNFLPSGNDFGSWVGRSVTVRLGLRDIASTYTTIFSGKITAESGFSRSSRSIKIVARDNFDSLNSQFPRVIFSPSTYPDIEEDKIGLAVPIIYGDWTTDNDPKIKASVPCFVVNGANDDVNGETSNTVNIQCVISDNNLTSIDTNNLYFKRGDTIAKVDPADITNIGPGNKTFEVVQDGITIVDDEGTKLLYGSGDEFFIRCVGKNLGVYTNNVVQIARDILLTYSAATPADFDVSWDTLRDKASPAASAIANIPVRVWLQDPQNTIEYCLSLLEQVRLEFFVGRNLKLKLTSLHLEDFVAAPTFTIRNWDIVRNSFTPKIDDRNNRNRIQAEFNFLPAIGQNYSGTPVFKNQASIDQIGTGLYRKILFPNLYKLGDVESQVIEILKISSSIIEIVDVELTWRSLLLDIGDFVTINISIEGVVFENVPCLIRSIGYDPAGLKIIATLWSLQMLPFPGYNPGYNGTVGGATAIIEGET